MVPGDVRCRVGYQLAISVPRELWFGLGTSNFSCGWPMASLVLLVVVAISDVVKCGFACGTSGFASVFPSSKVQSMNVLEVLEHSPEMIACKVWFCLWN